MARTKKFSGGTKITDFDEVFFELNEQRFDCHRAIQGAVLLEFARYADEEGGGAKALYDFLKGSMSESEYERLQAVLRDPEVIIDIEVIGEIVSWLVEVYSSRPTSPPEDSSTGE
jgi:hypothetical protein